MNSVESPTVRAKVKLHAVKNVAGIISMLGEVCNGSRNIPQEWRDIEKQVFTTGHYENIPAQIKEWIEYLKTLQEPPQLKGRLGRHLNDLEVKISEIEKELFLPDESIRVNREEFRSRILSFLILANESRSPSSPEAVFRFIDFEHEIHKLIHLELPSEYYTYPRAFKASLRNLVANARKFSKAGDVVRLFCSQSNTGHLTLTVEDSGIGIPAHELEKVTQPEYRASNNTNKGYGYGMGLTVVQSFANDYGGTLSIESTENVGTSVTLSFPYGK